MKAAAFFAAAVMAAAGFARADDTVAPAFTSISITPATAEVGTEDQVVTVTVEITDDDSGFEFGNVFLYNPAGQFVTSAYFDGAQRTAGTPLDGTYEIPLTLPRYGAAGTWRVDGLALDLSANQSNYGPGNTPFPVPEDAQIEVTNGGEVDSSPPVLVSSTLSATAVGTTAGPATVTVMIQCQDDLSGFDYGYVYVKDPDDNFAFDLFGYIHQGTRVSGDEFDAIHEIHIVFPEGSAPGNWELDLYLKDRTGNSIFEPLGVVRVNQSLVPSFLAQAVDALHLPVSSSGSGWIHQTDTTFDGIDAAASRAVPDGGEAVMQTTVTGPGTLSFEWRVDSEEFADVLSVEVVGGDSEETSGFQDWSTVSLAIPAGEQTVVWRYTKDGSAASGEDRGWVDRVRFVADTEDHELPRLQGLHFSTREADITENEAEIEFLIKVSDDFHGFSQGTLRLIDPEGFERTSTVFDLGSRIDGDDLAGIYQVYLTVGDDWPLGKGRVEVELTEAVTGLTRFYSPMEDEFPLPDMEVFHVVSGGGDDLVKPVLRALEVTPRTVDVSAGPATVTVTLRVTDDGRGFSDGNVALLTPANGYAGAYSLFPSDERKYDGIHQVEIEIPQYGVPGTWSLSCYLRDVFSNDREYPWTDEFGADSDPSITVVNTGAIDGSAPSASAASITPDQVDTSAAGVPVEVTVTLTENLSGLRDAYLLFYNPSNVYQPDLFAILDASNRISGDEMNGTYRVTRTIPQGSAAGTWRVDVFLRDRAGNERSYSPFAETLPGERTFEVGSGPAPSLFEAFVATHSLQGADALAAADPDHDGRINAVELMQGTDPNDGGDAGGFTISRDATHLHLDFTIAAALTVAVDGVHLELSDASGGAPLRLTGQTQGGLAGPWSDVLPIHQGGRTWRVSVPFSTGTQGFARLDFEEP
jgi:hypothetical protein